MARTAQTARKSTGGKEPQKDLHEKATRRLPRKTVPKSKVGKVRQPRWFKPGSKYSLQSPSYPLLTAC